MSADYLEISDELFSQIGKMITERYGIKMPPEKKIMFQARLQKHLREFNIHSFEDYVATLHDDGVTTAGFELLSDLISTNKTEFFRENDHFLLLSDLVLPNYLKHIQFTASKSLEVWSAGCSSGQEAYSLAIQIEEFIRWSGIRFNYSVFATDISRTMLHQAKEAIYPMMQVDEMPLELKKRYLLKSKNQEEKKIRIVKEVREKITVAYQNLMDAEYPFNQIFDVVFLRNTLIYFETEIQMKVLKKVIDCLKSGGFLFIGHAESLLNFNLPMQQVAPSVYVKSGSKNDE